MVAQRKRAGPMRGPWIETMGLIFWRHNLCCAEKSRLLIRQYFQTERRKSFYTNNNSRFVGTAQIVPLKDKASCSANIMANIYSFKYLVKFLRYSLTRFKTIFKKWHWNNNQVYLVIFDVILEGKVPWRLHPWTLISIKCRFLFSQNHHKKATLNKWLDSLEITPDENKMYRAHWRSQRALVWTAFPTSSIRYSHRSYLTELFQCIIASGRLSVS